MANEAALVCSLLEKIVIPEILGDSLGVSLGKDAFRTVSVALEIFAVLYEQGLISIKQLNSLVEKLVEEIEK